MSMIANGAGTGVAPVISGTVAGQTDTGNAPVNPFAAVTITDGNSGATDTLTITLSGSGGTLADGTGFSGLSGSGTVYSLSGTAAAITAELAKLVFTPAALAPNSAGTTSFSLTDTSSGYVAVAYNPAPTIIGTFNQANGNQPFSGLVSDAAGNLFGTTAAGGANNAGAVYEMIKTSTGYSGPVLIASMDQSLGTILDSSLYIDSAGDLFGTAHYGGTANDGAVFEIVKGSGGYSAPRVLVNFTGANGANPVAGLVADAAGNLFGTTLNGGPQGGGTVFELVRNGNSFSAPVNLTSAATVATGYNPAGSLLIDSAGNLFGTASAGGSAGDGTVVEIRKTATGYAAPVVIANFLGSNGTAPNSNLISDAAGDLFGTTTQGGAHGFGTVFELVKTGGGYGAPLTLASFDGVASGAPQGGLVMDAAGDLFGTAGETSIVGDGSGIYELAKTASGYAAPVFLYTFNGGNNLSTGGEGATGNLLIAPDGTLFGVTTYGGSGNGGLGTVYQLGKGPRPVPVTDGKTTVINTVPAAAPTLTGVPVTQNTATNIPVSPFNTAVFTDLNAGATDTLTITVTGGAGTVHDGTFNGVQLVANGNGTYTATGHAADIEQLLANLTFTAATGTPTQSVTTTIAVKIQSSAYAASAITATTSVIAKTPAVAPTITGLAASTSAKNGAPVTPFAGVTIGDGNPGATETVTIEFGGAGGMLRDGAGFAGLQKVTAQHYTLTGSAAAVTAELDALVFTPAAGAAGTTTFTLANTSSAFGEKVYSQGISFVATIPTPDSTVPTGVLIADAAGNLYGETSYSQSSFTNGGTVFELPKTASGFGTAIVLAQFTLPATRNGPTPNGTGPAGGLVMDAAGNLFGVTVAGGKYGGGTVFEIAHTATGYDPVRVLASFQLGADGNTTIPNGRLVFDSAGNLFGTTATGGTHGDGAVFELFKTATGYSTIKVIANLAGGLNGFIPAQNGLTIDAANNLFLVTREGGYGQGDIMELVKTATAYTKAKPVFSFAGALGNNPQSGLVVSPRGDLFGTTYGTSFFGPPAPSTVYELGKTKLGFSKSPVLVADLSATIGAQAVSQVSFNGAGDIFGLAQTTSGVDEVYEIVRTPTGYSAPVVVGSFVASQNYLFGNLLIDAAGSVFGLVGSSGGYTGGYVFELASSNLVTTVTNTVTTAAAALLAAGDTSGRAFAVAGTPGTQVISGFVASGPAHDILGVSSSMFADWAHLLGATKQQGSDLVITLAPGEDVRLTNVALASFTQADVHFT